MKQSPPANCLIFGPPGAGKSHLASAIGLALVENGYRVLFTRTTDLVQRLQVARRELALESLLSRLDRYHLLILDDLAYVRKALAAYGMPEIFNTDQGSQFTSFAFTARLREAGIRISMDGRGRCMDNIFIERLWRSLKYEAVYLHEIADGFTARRVIGEWIGFYNTIRPHSALGGRTPAEAYRGDTPVDMMDKPLRALTTYPQAQQQQQEDRFKRILAA